MGEAKPFTTYERTRRFDRAFDKLTTQQQKQAAKAAALLFDNPAHPSLEAHAVKPDGYFWEAYINRNDRIIYIREGSHLVLVDIVRHDHIGKYGKAP